MRFSGVVVGVRGFCYMPPSPILNYFLLFVFQGGLRGFFFTCILLLVYLFALQSTSARRADFNITFLRVSRTLLRFPPPSQEGGHPSPPQPLPLQGFMRAGGGRKKRVVFLTIIETTPLLLPIPEKGGRKNIGVSSFFSCIILGEGVEWQQDTK